MVTIDRYSAGQTTVATGSSQWAGNALTGSTGSTESRLTIPEPEAAVASNKRKDKRFDKKATFDNEALELPDRGELELGSERTSLNDEQCEVLKGSIESVEGDLALLRLSDSSGQEYLGNYSAQELAQKGLKAGDALICRVRQIGNTTECHFEPDRWRPLPPDQDDAIRNELEKKFSGDVFDGDY